MRPAEGGSRRSADERCAAAATGRRRRPRAGEQPSRLIALYTTSPSTWLIAMPRGPAVIAVETGTPLCERVVCVMVVCVAMMLLRVGSSAACAAAEKSLSARNAACDRAIRHVSVGLTERVGRGHRRRHRGHHREPARPRRRTDLPRPHLLGRAGRIRRPSISSRPRPSRSPGASAAHWTTREGEQRVARGPRRRARVRCQAARRQRRGANRRHSAAESRTAARPVSRVVRPRAPNEVEYSLATPTPVNVR
jgi:hypothetical protein